MNAPCKGCPDRTLGCHGTCKKYKAFDNERQKARQNRLESGEQTEISLKRWDRIQKERKRDKK